MNKIKLIKSNHTNKIEYVVDKIIEVCKDESYSEYTCFNIGIVIEYWSDLCFFHNKLVPHISQDSKVETYVSNSEITIKHKNFVITLMKPNSLTEGHEFHMVYFAENLDEDFMWRAVMPYCFNERVLGL